LSYTVEIRPSGRCFVAEGRDTVLEAGLKAGANLDYGCSNGNCGNCRARLVSGTLERLRHSDFHFSESETHDGHFLTCVHAPASDLVIETLEADAPGDIAIQEIETRIRRAERIDEQVMLLHLQTPRSRRLRFLAGQSVVLGGRDLAKSLYPVASCPCDDRNLMFHIPDIPGDLFAEQVFAGAVASGGRVNVRGPKRGDFFLGRDVTRPLLFVCWHTGFAPIQSLIENAMALEIEQDMRLFRLSPTPGHHYLANQCRAWADAFDNFHYREWPERFTLLADHDTGARVLAAIVGECGSLAGYRVFVAGPPALVDAAKEVFGAAGADAADVAVEACGLGFFT